MKLPNWENAVVPREKVVKYLLSFEHEDGSPKAVFFARFGFTLEDWEGLAVALVRHAGEHEVKNSVSSSYGMRYIVVGEMDTPDGRRPVVKVVWFIDDDNDLPRLVTAYPGRK